MLILYIKKKLKHKIKVFKTSIFKYYKTITTYTSIYLVEYI